MVNDSEETVVVVFVSGFLLILNEYNQKKSGNNSDRKNISHGCPIASKQ
ncbi:hypothetical protein J31TS3_23310 [Paenibacillus lactis]|nr:hypothetical protein J31TS3_23310 [Paenibacillus lactis]